MQTVADILMTERLMPFLCQEAEQKPDFVLEISPSMELPQIDLSGQWRGQTCYLYRGQEKFIFHCKEVYAEPFAVTSIRRNGDIQLNYLPQYADYFTGSSGIFNRIGLETMLLQHQRLLLHASFVKYRENGILFSAPSGTGKSTQAELWRKGMGAQIINGDRVAICRTQQKWTAWGIPYAGTSRIYRNDHAPISAVVVLRQAKHNRIQRLQGGEIFRCLYPELSVHHWEQWYVNKVTSLLQKMIFDVPVFLLECLPEESAVQLLHQTLEKEGLLK